MAQKQNTKLETIISLAKRRGFIFQSSEIYGGINGCWDYGPLGVELLQNIKNAWWKEMTYRDDIEGIDASILMHPKVWEASGHLKAFSDPMIDNKVSKARHRADNLIEDFIQKLKAKTKNEKAKMCEERLNAAQSNEDLFNIIVEFEIPDPVSGTTSWTEVRNFNLMFKTFIGPLDDAASTIYLRPESAQGIFVNFKNVLETGRQKVPFGIAQIGKAFRNEINTKNFLFRTREFEQMEMQYFIKPGTDKDWFEYWQQERWNWYLKYGIKPDKLKLKPHTKLAHYANHAVDIEFEFPFGFGEIEGIHSRTDYDLMAHQSTSGKKLEYVDTETKERFVPWVIETSGGVSRGLMAFLCNAYKEDKGTALDQVAVSTGCSPKTTRAYNEGAPIDQVAPGYAAAFSESEKVAAETRVLLQLHSSLAPIKVAVFPLVNKEGMPEKAHALYKDLQKHFKTQYDTSGAIGRRYRRQDEIGTPYCITVDGDTMSNGTVTIRERDSMQQERIDIAKVREYLVEKLNG